METFDRLLERARSSVHGSEANQTLWTLREELEARYRNVVLYEMVLGQDLSWDTFLKSLVPRLTEHLFAKGVPMLGGPNVIVSVWRGSTMFIFEPDAFFDAIREIEGISADELKIRISAWRLAAGFPNGLPGVTVSPERLLLGSGPSIGDPSRGTGGDGKPS
jgi:hypothetical protein